jgi:hypothetical protein
MTVLEVPGSTRRSGTVSGPSDGSVLRKSVNPVSATSGTATPDWNSAREWPNTRTSPGAQASSPRSPMRTEEFVSDAESKGVSS